MWRQFKKSLITISDKTDYIEGQSRRNNIIIDGISESATEKWSDCEDKVKKLLSEKLQLDHRKTEGLGSHLHLRPQPDPDPSLLSFCGIRTNWRSSTKPKH